MKKHLLSTLLVLLLLATLIPAAAFAANDSFASAFFPNGKIAKPAAPYIFYEDDVYSEANGDELTGFFELPADIRRVNEVMAKYTDINDFDNAYGTCWGYNLRLQLDSKLDDGPWQYNGAWDTASYTGAMEVNANEFALGYLKDIDVNETDKMIKWFRFSDLSCIDSSDFEGNAGWAADAIYQDGDVYRFDFKNHTFSYRYRYLIEYTLAGDGELHYLLSNWSDTVSIGKNGTLKPLTAPTTMPAPVLSQFNASVDDEGNSYAAFYEDIPQAYYDGNAYYEVLDNDWDNVYRIHCEMKVNGADWREVTVGNDTWMSNGYKSIFYDKVNARKDDAVQIRTRVENLKTGMFSPYSNVIGATVIEASAWAEPYIDQAIEMNILPTCLEGADMTQKITRQEFAALAVKVYEKMSGNTSVAPGAAFADCTDTEVLKAVAIGITNGTNVEKNLFSPSANITREQCAAMLARAYKATAFDGWTLGADSSFNSQFKASFTMPAKFADDSKISAYAKDSVYFMVANGIINGVGNNMFAPVADTTKGAAYGMATREAAIKIAVEMVNNL